MTTARTPGLWTCKALQAYDTPGYVILWRDTSKPGVHMRRLDYKGSFTEADARAIAAVPVMIHALECALASMESGVTSLGAIRAVRAALAMATEAQP